jgi:hypothetical protein
MSLALAAVAVETVEVAMPLHMMVEMDLRDTGLPLVATVGGRVLRAAASCIFQVDFA